jgi:hypothetical protein
VLHRCLRDMVYVIGHITGLIAHPLPCFCGLQYFEENNTRFAELRKMLDSRVPR